MINALHFIALNCSAQVKRIVHSAISNVRNTAAIPCSTLHTADHTLNILNNTAAKKHRPATTLPCTSHCKLKLQQQFGAHLKMHSGEKSTLAPHKILAMHDTLRILQLITNSNWGRNANLSFTLFSAAGY